MGHSRFDVTRRDAGSVTVLAVRGAVDMSRCRRLVAAIHEALRDGPEQLVLDLCGIEFVDSSGLGVLVHARRRALRLGIQLKLVCNVPSALKVLSLTGLDRAFDVYPTSEGALAASGARALVS